MIRNVIQTIGTGLNVDRIPAAGFEEMWSHFGSSVFTAVGAPFNFPRMRVGLTDGTFEAWFLNHLNTRGWTGPRHILINPTTYLRMFNPAAGGNQILSGDGEELHQFGSGISNVVSGVADLLTTAFIDVRPAAGDAYHVWDVCSELWVGVAPNALPDVTVELVSVNPAGGFFTAIMLTGAEIKQWFTEDVGLYITNDVWMRITNTNGATQTVGWSAERMDTYGTGANPVRSAVVPVGIGGVATLQALTATEEIELYNIGTSIWFAGGPPNFPDVNVENTNGFLASLVCNNANVEGWLHPFKLPISITNYVTMTNTNAAGVNIGYSALLKKA